MSFVILVLETSLERSCSLGEFMPCGPVCLCVRRPDLRSTHKRLQYQPVHSVGSRRLRHHCLQALRTVIQ